MMNLGLPKVSGEYKGNPYPAKNFSDENFTNASQREFMFEHGREILHRSRSDGEVIRSRPGQESEETWYSILKNDKELQDEHPRERINLTVEGEIMASSSAEVSNGELSEVVLLDSDTDVFITNCLMSKTSPDGETKPYIDRNQNQQQSLAKCEERGKVKGGLSVRELSSVLQQEVIENCPLSKASSEPVKMAEINSTEVSDGELPEAVLLDSDTDVFITNCLMSKTSPEAETKPYIDRNQNQQQPLAECAERGKVTCELSDRELSSVLQREFVENCSLSKASSEPVELAEINISLNDQQSLEKPEEKGKIGDDTPLIVLDDCYQKDKKINENEQITQKSSISLEDICEGVDKRATFYIGSRPNSGKRDEGSNSRAQSQAFEYSDTCKQKQGNGVEEGPPSPKLTQYDFYDDIEVILDEPTDRNETKIVGLSMITDCETSPFYDQTKSVTESSLQSIRFENKLINGCNESSLLLPIVSEQPTLPQPNRIEKPVALRAQPFCPFECSSGPSEHKTDVKIDVNEWIDSGVSRYSCGEKYCHRDNTEMNLISLSSSSESNCSECDSKIKELSKKNNEIDLPITVSDEDPIMVFQCPKPSDKLQLMDKTYSPLYSVKSHSDLSILVPEETKSLNPHEVKNVDASETTTPPLLITVETNPHTIDVDNAGMKSNFYTTIPNPERPTSASPKHDYESYIATDHVVPTKLCDEKAHMGKSTQVLNEGSSNNDDETVIDEASRNGIKLGTRFGENVREQPSQEMFSISDGVDPNLIHFFTHDAVSPPPISAVSGSTNTSVDNEVADIMNTGSDDYVIEFKSESSNDWTISSAESDVGNAKVPVSFDRKNDKDIYVESRLVPATSPEPLQAYSPKEFLIDMYQGSDNMYNEGFNLVEREEFIEKDERTIKVHNDDKNFCSSKTKKQPYGTDEQSYEDENKMLISISPFKPLERENTTPESMYEGGDILINEPSVKVFIDKSTDRNQYNNIDSQENIPAKSDDLTDECDKMITGKPKKSRRIVENISDPDCKPLERTTDSETLLDKLPSVPSEPPTVVRKGEPSLDMKHVLAPNVDSWPAVCNDVVSLTATTDEDVGSVTYPELDIFAKARLRHGGLYNWEMNCLLTELSREQEENKRLVRDSKRAMHEFVQLRKEVENILSKFGSQICVEMF